jgi:hypothetical protein
MDRHHHCEVSAFMPMTTLTIQASKNGELVETPRSNSVLAVAQARMLLEQDGKFTSPMQPAGISDRRNSTNFFHVIASHKQVLRPLQSSSLGQPWFAHDSVCAKRARAKVHLNCCSRCGTQVMTMRLTVATLTTHRLGSALRQDA